MSLYPIDLHGSGQTPLSHNNPYTDNNQHIPSATRHNYNMFHKSRNPQTAKPENRSSLILWLMYITTSTFPATSNQKLCKKVLTFEMSSTVHHVQTWDLNWRESN